MPDADGRELLVAIRCAVDMMAPDVLGWSTLRDEMDTLRVCRPLNSGERDEGRARYSSAMAFCDLKEGGQSEIDSRAWRGSNGIGPLMTGLSFAGTGGGMLSERESWLYVLTTEVWREGDCCSKMFESDLGEGFRGPGPGVKEIPSRSAWPCSKTPPGLRGLVI